MSAIVFDRRLDGQVLDFGTTGKLRNSDLVMYDRQSENAWPLERLKRAGTLAAGDLVLSWQAGQNSVLDADRIEEGRDIGNIVVQRRTNAGLADVVHDITFAFVFHAFRPTGTLHLP